MRQQTVRKTKTSQPYSEQATTLTLQQEVEPSKDGAPMGQLRSRRMFGTPPKPEIGSQKQPDIFERLKRRGIEYERIMQIAQFESPQNLFFFARQFGNRTIKDVIKHIESWKQFLKREFLLTPDKKALLTQWVRVKEDFVWATIRDANFQIGDWTLHWSLTRPGQVELPNGEHVMSGTNVRATNQVTGEERTCEVHGCRRSAPRPLSEEWQEIYKALGLVNQLWLGAPGPSRISGRSPQGWPVYARMIPRLYDLMAPHYKSRGHYSDGVDRQKGKVERSARYPKELFADMLEILRLHHGTFFEKTTLAQIKAAVQHHLEKQAAQGAHTP